MSSSEDENNSRVSEQESDSEEMDSDKLSETSRQDSIKEGMPENLKDIFKTKDVYKGQDAPSLFTKSRAEQVNSSNLENDKMAKAEAVFQKFALFGEPSPKPVTKGVDIKGKQVEKIAADAKKIKPLNSLWLDKKERQKQRELDAGKAWGYMPKVELTEELKNDLKALRMRNQIFPKRFFKSNDSDKLPQYFQIATVIDDGLGSNSRTSKKFKKGSIA